MTQDEIIPLPQYLNASYEGDDLYTGKQLIEYAKLVAAKEREACAKLCDGLADMHEKMNQWGSHKTADTLAQAIRARGEA